MTLTADFSRCSLLLLASAACLADAAPGAALPTRRAQAKEASAKYAAMGEKWAKVVQCSVHGGRERV